MTNSIIFTCDTTESKYGSGVTVKDEADQIVVKVLLGYIATRYYTQQPLAFHMEPGEYSGFIGSDFTARELKTRLGKEIYNRYEHFEKFLEWCQEQKFDGHSIIRNLKDKNHCLEQLELLSEDSLFRIAHKYNEYNDKLYSKEYAEFSDILSTLSYVVDLYHGNKEMGHCIKDGNTALKSQSPGIVGQTGGGGQTSTSWQHRVNNEKARKDTIETIKSSTSCYKGRGAYTGCIDDPTGNNTEIWPTLRIKYKDKWVNNSGRGIIGAKNEKYYNEVNKRNLNNLDNYKELKDGGMGNATCSLEKGEMVGYIHGMCSAIVRCEQLGPWTTPYELAAGNCTSKMASCFACTTYMTSTGYPPSSAHLGRGESWYPPRKSVTSHTFSDCYPMKCPLDKYGEKATMLEQKWKSDVKHWLKLGDTIVSTAIKKTEGKKFIENRGGNYKNNIPVDILTPNQKSIHEKISSNLESEFEGNVYFLRALTFHDKETNRVKNVFKPVFDLIQKKQLEMAEKVGNNNDQLFLWTDQTSENI